jgi:methylmalonyl-CoA mutase
MGLFNEFDGVTHQQWKEKIIADLKGKDFDSNLITTTEDGFDIQPIYNSETLANNKSSSYHLANKNSDWEIREQISVSNIKKANQQALLALKGGANSIQFNGEINTQEDFNLLLDGIMINIIHIHFYTPNTSNAQHFLENYTKLNKFDTKDLNYSISYDYLGAFLISGNENKPFQVSKEHSITVNGYNYTNAGASSSQELAYILNQAVAYINKSIDEGLSVETTLNKLRFNLGISSNYFMEIAKIRAFKILYRLVTTEYGIETTPNIHAQTTTYNISAADAQTNILRTTTEAMAAIIGGCNSLSITPFNSAYETPSNFTHRVARNIQILLKEEAYLDKVNEAAKGAYYIEELTDNLINSALTIFKEVEAKGGFITNINNGHIQNTIEQNHNNRLSKYIANDKTLLGINKHPNKMENTPKTLKGKAPNNPTITPLTPINLGELLLNNTAEAIN